MNTSNKYLGYLRVSTDKQGSGVSLQEQKAAIEEYSRHHDLHVAHWLEEKATAAKHGRPKFTQLLEALRTGTARGVILYKIDRGARNLRDWTDLTDLIDAGVEVHLSGDRLDLTSRGGRLAADIQAVVATDFIRNLREEARRGIQGRLKQGLFPFHAPLGYLDQGRGKVKVIDGSRAQLVREAFQRYAIGDMSLRALAKEMEGRGLRNERGGVVTPSRLGATLRNPWYYGRMRSKRAGQLFPGRHVPLVNKELFDQVQVLLDGKYRKKVLKHRFLFQRLLRCGTCGYAITGEYQKRHVYYRCHSSTCRNQVYREEFLEGQVLEQLQKLDANLSKEYQAAAHDGKRAIVIALLGNGKLSNGYISFQKTEPEQQILRFESSYPVA